MDLSVLSPEEEADVVREAKAFARKKGVAEPKQDDPEYELGQMVFTLAAAIRVPRKGPDDTTDLPFFRDAKSILASRELGRDGIVYLFQAQKSYQAEVAPGFDPGATPERYVALCMEIAGVASAGPFFAQKLAFQLSYVRFTANLLSSFLMHKSLSGLVSNPDGLSTSETAETASSSPVKPTSGPSSPRPSGPGVTKKKKV